jgi:hypothetical protein
MLERGIAKRHTFGLFAILLLAISCMPANATTVQPVTPTVVAATIEPTKTVPTPPSTPTVAEAPILSAATAGQVDVVVTVEASAYQVKVGDTISVTVRFDYNLAPGCSYPLYDVTLEPVPNDPQLVRFETPARIGPPGPNPAPYTLTAIAAGTLKLRGLGYGEINCGNGWQWSYRMGESSEITISPATTQYLPQVMAIG